MTTIANLCEHDNNSYVQVSVILRTRYYFISLSPGSGLLTANMLQFIGIGPYNVKRDNMILKHEI